MDRRGSHEVRILCMPSCAALCIRLGLSGENTLPGAFCLPGGGWLPMKTRTWICIFILLLVFFLALALLLHFRGSGTVANVYQNGVCIRSVDLSRLTEPIAFTVRDGEGHENLVEAEPGRIRVREASCPDQICVQRGWLDGGREPIVCLPAKLVIRLEKESGEMGEIDGVVG